MARSRKRAADTATMTAHGSARPSRRPAYVAIVKWGHKGMPDRVRITGGGVTPRPQRRGFRTIALSSITFVFSFASSHAQDAAPTALLPSVIGGIDRFGVLALALTLGVVGFAVVAAVALMRARRAANLREQAARNQIITLKADLDRAHALLFSEPQVLIAWSAADDAPEIIGDPTLVTTADAPHRVLAFGTWLEPEHALAMERAVEALRARGQGFSATLQTLAGQPLEAEGRVLGGRAVLRLRDVSGARRECAELAIGYQRLIDDSTALRTLAEAMPSAIWARNAAGQLVYANAAYARAVDAEGGEQAVARELELFDRGAREALAQAHARGETYQGRVRAVVAGSRRTIDVLMVPVPSGGSAGIGIDATEAESMRAEVARMIDAHRRTLDQLANAVAIFDANQRLTFYNAAYRSLWELDAGFLDQGPTDSAILDRLRSARRLPEEQDFRQWKTQLYQAYRALEPREHTWHLPDGRTLRVVTTPNPEGGVTYVFDDVTERLDLARRYDALIRVQGETLDHLTEAVAVFGSDGRLRLNNPHFATMWRLPPAMLAERPHIETVIGQCRRLHGDEGFWRALQTTVTAIDERGVVTGRLERYDGSVVDCATVPLPDGATLLTFADVTDSVNVERALRERNEALEEADELKLNFLHHVSYELRSPLTNIIGFAHFLGEMSTGPLNERQREYLGYITTSTNALLALINNILDLATIDAGAMTLNSGPVDIRSAMESAVEGVQDRLVRNDIKLAIEAAPDVGTFTADERRVRQVLFNLLSNAVGFSPAGGTVTFSAQRRPDSIVFSVADQGPGIPPEAKDKVFDWFETNSRGSSHRGVGLGLALVRSFVELHGGTVKLDSEIGRGTTVTCVFPLEQQRTRVAAE